MREGVYFLGEVSSFSVNFLILKCRISKWLISLYIRQHFIYLYLKNLFFIFLCKYVLSSSVHIDIEDG